MDFITVIGVVFLTFNIIIYIAFCVTVIHTGIEEEWLCLRSTQNRSPLEREYSNVPVMESVELV